MLTVEFVSPIHLLNQNPQIEKLHHQYCIVILQHLSLKCGSVGMGIISETILCEHRMFWKRKQQCLHFQEKLVETGPKSCGWNCNALVEV